MKHDFKRHSAIGEDENVFFSLKMGDFEKSMLKINFCHALSNSLIS